MNLIAERRFEAIGKMDVMTSLHRCRRSALCEVSLGLNHGDLKTDVLCRP